MRHAFLTVPVLTALALAGCGKSTRNTPPSTPVALADFCTGFVDSICTNVARCSCSPTADADCRADLANTCANQFISPEVQARITAGTVTYNASAAGAMIAGLHAQTSCDNPMTIFGWGIREVFTFGGTLNGTKAPGAACTGGTGGAPFGGECANGMCMSTGSEPTTCWGFVGLGAPCGLGINSICVDLNATFTSLDNADILLRCNVAAGATTGTCAARLANGASCSSSYDCASDRCDPDVCVAALANGVACSSSGDCLSGYCRYAGTTSVCAAAGAIADGSACTDDQECASGTCPASVCVPGICATYDTPAPPPMPVP